MQVVNITAKKGQQAFSLALKSSFYLSLQGRKISSLRTHKTGRGDEVALKNNLPDGLEKLERWKNPFFYVVVFPFLSYGVPALYSFSTF